MTGLFAYFGCPRSGPYFYLDVLLPSLAVLRMRAVELLFSIVSSLSKLNGATIFPLCLLAVMITCPSIAVPLKRSLAFPDPLATSMEWLSCPDKATIASPDPELKLPGPSSVTFLLSISPLPVLQSKVPLSAARSMSPEPALSRKFPFPPAARISPDPVLNAKPPCVSFKVMSPDPQRSRQNFRNGYLPKTFPS